MAKDMYQKRRERKAKTLEENGDKEGVQKNVINWDIGTNVKPLSIPCKIRLY